MIEIIKKIHTLRGIKKDFKNLTQVVLIFKRSKLIKEYFRTHNIAKLHLGSNLTLVEGWLCSDIMPKNKQCIILDVTKKFPFNDNTFDYIYCEHLIEHLNLKEGMFMLKECFRVLRRNGHIRIATPDLEIILRLFSERDQHFGTEYIHWITDNFIPEMKKYDPVIAVNTTFHNWGHQFLYDFTFLKEVLTTCGYSEIERCAYNRSSDSNLQNIERHHKNVGNLSMVEFETFIAEAVKK